MKKKIFVAGLLLTAFTTQLMAQENDEAPKAKKEEKIIIKKLKRDKKSAGKTIVADEIIMMNGEAPERMFEDDAKATKRKRVTVMIDGDNITIDGKPVDKMNDIDIKMLRESADCLGDITPYIYGTMNGTTNEGGTINGKFKIPQDAFLYGDNKALLGVTTEKNEKGAAITTISKESAAEKAGLKIGDIITKVNDDKIESSIDLPEAISRYNPEDKVKITYLRDGKIKTTEAILGKNNIEKARVFKWNNSENIVEEMPPMPPMIPEMFGNIGSLRNIKPRMGLKIQDVEEGSGVKVLEVDENTPAAKAGLLKDDIINEINGDAIKSVDDLKEKTSKVKEGDVYKVRYTRRGSSETTEIKFPKKLKTADL